MQPQPQRHMTYSQFGEDIFLQDFFKNVDVGFYVDVGCYAPFSISNTAKLYQKGWRGINIDSDEQAIHLFEKERPDDINLQLGVHTNKEPMVMYTCDIRGMNMLHSSTASEDSIKHPKKIYTKGPVVAVDTLENILDTYLPKGQQVQLLDVDTEGSDLAVLQSNNWNRYRPKVVLVESAKFPFENPNENEIYVFMKKQGYELSSVYHITLIFVRKG